LLVHAGWWPALCRHFCQDSVLARMLSSTWSTLASLCWRSAQAALD
jgi:hypothetical protein